MLLQIETSWDKNQLVGAERLLPMLERVAKNDSFMNMARERADRLIIAIHNGKGPPQKESTEAAEGSAKQ